MTNDPLERVRRLNPVREDVPAPPIAAVQALRALEPTLPTARRRPFVGAGWLVPMLGSVMAVAIAVLAILTLTHRSHQRTESTSPTVPPAARQLVSELSALRRSQTAADLNSADLREFLRPVLSTADLLRGTPIRSLIRLAAVTPFGKVFLVPFLPPTKSAIAKLPARLRAFDQGHLATLGLVAAGGAACCSTSASIAAHGAEISSGPSPARVVLVIPDGVAKVTILLPRQAIPGGRVYQHSLSITVPVHDNVATLEVNRDADEVGAQDMIWYGPAGNIVKRIGNNRDLNRVIPPPKPSPPTALSRRAEADPATPNPVSVTPAIGGPTTTFTVSFRLLLNGASYEYHFTGPGGPGCRGNTPSRSDGEIGGGPRDIRGQIFSEPFSPQTGALAETRWCPGVFHVSVTAARVPGNHTPFGTATFTVKGRQAR